MPHVGRVGIGLLAIALGCLAGSVEAADAPSRHVLSYRNDRLSVRAAGVPLDEIVAEIGEASGAHVSGALRDPRDVSAEFEDVPLEEALHRLLGEQNFVLKYGRDDHLRTIKLLGGPQAPVAQVHIVPAASSEPTPKPEDPTVVPGVPHDVDGALALLDKQPPIPVSGDLAQALGTENATLRQLFDVVSNSDSSTVRAEAMRTFVGAMDSQPEFRNAALGTLAELDDGTLTELLRGLAGSRAEEIAAAFAASAQLNEVSSRAFSIYLLLGGTRGTTGTDIRPAS